MNRRRLLLVLGAWIAEVTALPRAYGQPGNRKYRIGLLLSTSRQHITTAGIWSVFEQALRERGYVEGQNLVFEERKADGRLERLPALAADIAALKLDLIFTGNDTAAVALRKATATTPIVFAAAGDPVGIGLVQSLARPGGNATGLASFTDAMIGKQLELLREAFPQVRRLGVLYSSKTAAGAKQLQALEAARARLKVEAAVHDVSADGGLEAAFRAVEQQRPDALLVLVSISTFFERSRIAQFAAAKRLPAMYGLPENVEAGGLMGYSFSLADNFRRAAGYIDRILRGARPAEMPVEQPSKFELVINMKTARAIGVSVPQTLLLRADRVIE